MPPEGGQVPAGKPSQLQTCQGCTSTHELQWKRWICQSHALLACIPADTNAVWQRLPFGSLPDCPPTDNTYEMLLGVRMLWNAAERYVLDHCFRRARSRIDSEGLS